MKPREYELDSPIAAIATALVPAALGIVRVSGTNSIEIQPSFPVQRHFALPGAIPSITAG